MVSMVTLLILAAGWTAARGDEPPAQEQPPAPPQVLSLDDALNWALQNNPEILAFRSQHGVAAAAVVIAQTYPFNPISENRSQVASGPESAGVTNNLPLEHLLLWEVEIRGQRRIRRSEAGAGLARTDWEIAHQEHLLAIRVIRAFRTLLYEQERYRLAMEVVELNEQLVARIQERINAGKLRPSDLIVAQTEVEDSRSLLDLARSSLSAARSEVRRALGVVAECFLIQGTLEVELPGLDCSLLARAGLMLRADRHAHEAAVSEANARLRLVIANRLGNPTIGPAFTYDNSRVAEAGVQINFPLPVLNTHRGEIQQAQAELTRANLELRHIEVAIGQDVQASLLRLEAARIRVERYRTQILPSLKQSLESVLKLLQAGEPGVDVLRVIDSQRKLLRARNGYLDARWELGQAQADLAAAVGEPALAVHPQWTPPLPCQDQPPP
jgi:outer membrane protein TolC